MSIEKKNWETDIELIKKDITQINKFFSTVEKSIQLMGDLTTQSAVQNEILKNTAEKLEYVEKLCEDTKRTDEMRMNVLSDRLEEYRRSSRDDHQRLAEHNAEKRTVETNSIIKKIDNMEKTLHNRLNDQAKQIRALENWRYYLMGVGAVVIFLLAKAVDIPNLFG